MLVNNQLASNIDQGKTVECRIPSNLVRPLISADAPFFENWTNLFSLIISMATVSRISVLKSFSSNLVRLISQKQINSF